MRLTLQVQYRSSCINLPDKPTIAKWAQAALQGMPDDKIELGVRIVDEPESAELNQRYRKKAGPTNVLSFPFEDPPGVKIGLLGDLVLCAPVVQREAKTGRRLEDAHWAHMVVHGIMHLRGYDHEGDVDARIMEGMETKILETLGFPDPYA